MADGKKTPIVVDGGVDNEADGEAADYGGFLHAGTQGGYIS